MKGGLHFTFPLLIEYIGDAKEVHLGAACRGLERLFARDGITDPVTPRTVSRLLRRSGWFKLGYVGSGYDREPLYVRRTAR